MYILCTANLIGILECDVMNIFNILAGLNWNLIFCIIFAVTVACYVKFFYQKMKYRKKGIQEINAMLDSHGEKEWNGLYEELDETLSHNSIIESNWKKYKKSLIKPVINDETKVYATVEADYYFNVTNFSSGLALGFWQNFAGIFTGLGILGTFIGLTFGIYGIDMTTNAGLQMGIGGLLKGAGTAFVTSVIGIILAILFNIIHHNFFMKNFMSDIDILVNHFDQIFPLIQVEQLMFDSLSEAKDQTVIQKNLGKDVATSFNEIINNMVNEEIKPVLDNLLSTIHDLNTGGREAIATSIGQSAGTELSRFTQSLQQIQEDMKHILEKSEEMNIENTRKLQEAVTQFVETMDKETTKNIDLQTKNTQVIFNQMHELFVNLNAELSETASKMQETSKSMSTNVGTTLMTTATKSDKFITTMDSMLIAQQKAMQDNVSRIQQLLENISGGIDGALTKHNQDMDARMQTLQNMIAASGKVVKSAGDTAKNFEAASRPMKDVASDMGGQLTRIIDASNKFNEKVEVTATIINDSADKNLENIKTIQDGLEMTKEAWKAYEDNFVGLSGELERSLNSLYTGLQKYNDLTTQGLARNLGEYDRSITKSIGQLSGILEALQEAIEDLQDDLKSKSRR